MALWALQKKRKIEHIGAVNMKKQQVLMCLFHPLHIQSIDLRLAIAHHAAYESAA
jgi:hypothetical protein